MAFFDMHIPNMPKHKILKIAKSHLFMIHRLRADNFEFKCVFVIDMKKRKVQSLTLVCTP